MKTLSSDEMQAGQVLLAIALAVFIGVRFVPPGSRQRIGIWLTVCYLIGVAMFVTYVALR
jgi:hypothetical protein